MTERARACVCARPLALPPLSLCCSARRPRASSEAASLQCACERGGGRVGRSARSVGSCTMSSAYPPSKHCHFNLVPGHQNTTTKEPMLRPPDLRVVAALASRAGR